MLRAIILASATLCFASQLFADPLRIPSHDLIRLAEKQNSHPVRALDADSSHSYDMLDLDLDYRVEDSPVPATGVASITFAALVSQASIPFNTEQLQVTAVQENGSNLQYVQQNDTLYVQRAVITGDTVTLDFTVSAPVIPDNADVGYHSAWQHAFTFSEPYGARRWYPCFDQPFDKFNHVRIAVNMPDYWSLAANGEKIETTFPAAGRKREVYVIDHPICTYLVMFCAGQYSKEYTTVNNIEYRYFALPGDSAKAAYDWERTPQMVALFDSLFGSYSFEQYGMVEAALFNGWGSMEHETFTTYGLHLVDSLRTFEYIVAHELTHQWFGDALSPVDFRNMWLNEGFATYGDALWQEHIGGRQHYHDYMAADAQQYFQEDAQFRYTAYDPPPAFLFGSVIYQKSAFVLHMLREQLLGDSLFFAALHAYVNAHRYGTVNTEDFIAAVNGVANQNLHWFFDQWIYQAGHPVLQITVTHGSPGPADVAVTVVQQQTNAPIFRIPISVDVTTTNGTFTRQFWFDQQTQTVVQNYGTPVLDATMTSYQPLLYQGTSSQSPNPPMHPLAEYQLGDAYPNPFNSTTHIPFDVTQPARVKLSLYDLTGRWVQTIVDAPYQAGHHDVSFEAGADLSTGLYIVALEANGQRDVKKLMLLK